MHGNLIKIVAISPEPGAVTLLGSQLKLLVANDLRQFSNRLFELHATELIYELAVVYY